MLLVVLRDLRRLWKRTAGDGLRRRNGGRLLELEAPGRSQRVRVEVLEERHSRYGGN